MDTTEIIHNALEWANKRLELQGEPITENQRNYIVFALRQQLTIPVIDFAQWYSGMERSKVEAAYQIYLTERREALSQVAVISTCQPITKTCDCSRRHDYTANFICDGNCK